MAITKGAKKAHSASLNKKVFNDSRKKKMKESVKEVRALVVGKKADEAQIKLPAAYKAIDKALKRGVIKKNTAARKKSRLVKFINKSK